VLDWFTRQVLAWRVSITLEADFCIAAVEEALTRHGKPEIFNTDHPLVVCTQTPAGQRGSQFTGAEFIKAPAAHEIEISMSLGDCKQSPAGNRWQRGLARQRLRRTPMEDHQIRGGLPAGLRRRIGGPGFYQAISQPLQRPAAPLVA
jgi:transposase InsO family protein